MKSMKRRVFQFLISSSRQCESRDSFFRCIDAAAVPVMPANVVGLCFTPGEFDDAVVPDEETAVEQRVRIIPGFGQDSVRALHSEPCAAHRPPFVDGGDAAAFIVLVGAFPLRLPVGLDVRPIWRGLGLRGSSCLRPTVTASRGSLAKHEYADKAPETERGGGDYQRRAECGGAFRAIAVAAWVARHGVPPWKMPSLMSLSIAAGPALSPVGGVHD